MRVECGLPNSLPRETRKIYVSRLPVHPRQAKKPMAFCPYDST